MMIFPVLLVAFVATAQANNVHNQWEKFKADYGKVYGNGKEHAKRFSIFKKNLMFIDEHNKLYQSGESTFTLGINEFTDMTNEEFTGQFTQEAPVVDVQEGSDNVYVANLKDLPKSVDWRTKGYVTSVKKQSSGCWYADWAFSSAGAIEGAHFKKTGKLVSLSAQNLLDCVENNFDCQGGKMGHAFSYVIQNKGIDTEASYPYNGKHLRKCQFNESHVGATISSFKKIQKGIESDLIAAIANEGPISVKIDASSPKFQHYQAGVYDDPECTVYDRDRSLLAVGYGSDNGTDYYIAKNSFGTSWGIKGYILMPRNKLDKCGIASEAAFPIA